MNILITPSKAVKAWLETYIKVDFHYTRLNETIFSMIDKEDTNILGMLSPVTVSDLRHATYFHIQLTRPAHLIGRNLVKFSLSDVADCVPELLEVEAKTVDTWILPTNIGD